MSKRKVKLPVDRNGAPINIDDWLMFDDGSFHVSTLTYYGKGIEPAIGGCWTAEDENGNFCDNLSAGCVIGRSGA
jgi:hypothetical protein